MSRAEDPMAPGGGRTPRHGDLDQSREWQQPGTAPRRAQQTDVRVPPTATGRPAGARQPRPAPINPDAYVPQFTAYGQRPEDQLRAQPRSTPQGYGQPGPEATGYGAEPYFDPQPVQPTQRGARTAGRTASAGRGHDQDPYGEPRTAGRPAAQSRDPRRAAPNTYDQAGYNARQSYGQPRQAGYDPGFDEPVAYEQPYQQQGYGAEPIADQYEGDADDYEDEDEETPRRGRRGLIVLGALVVAVALGGGLGYAYKLTGGDRSGVKPVVLKADTSPTKTKPADAGGQVFDTAKKSIYERLGSEIDADGDGIPDEVGADGQVVPRQEDVVTRTATGTEGEVAGLDVGDGVTLPQKPKKVNTVTIKPGETITADPAASADGGEDDAIPGISIAESVEQPPAIPAKKKKAAASVLEVPASEEAAAQEVVTAGEQETADVVQPVKKKKKKAVAEEQVALAEASAPAEPTATTQPASGGNGYVVQVRASKSRVDALGSFADLQQKYAELLGSTQPDIQQVDLGGTKGVWYRLRLGPPGSRKAAVDLCGKLKSQGLKECLVAAY